MDLNPASGPGSLCLVAGAADAPGVVETARSLVGRGWGVRVLFCGGAKKDLAFRKERRRLEAGGIGVFVLDELPLPVECRAPNGTPGCGDAVLTSHLVRHGLEALRRARRFDAVVFPTGNALGFRSVQAKRAGAAFPDVRLVVRLDGVSQWRREEAKRWPSPDDLFLDHCEKYAFENADIQISSCAGLFDRARRTGWLVRPEARVVSFLSRGDEAVLRPTVPPGFIDPPRPSGAAPTVTVAVSHYNLGLYLPETLASLAAQTCADLEVLIVDDGSTCEVSRRVLAEQQRLYPHFRFIRQANGGPGAARNRALLEARGEFFIPVDADNVAAPHMVERFLHGMRARPDLSAMTCFFLAFENTKDIAEAKFVHQYCPTGGPHLAACFFNVYGDATAMFRTRDLRAAGGFETDRSTYCEDWETFVKLAGAGCKIDVCPDYLFYYRRRRDGRSAVMTSGGTDLYPYVQRMMTNFFIADHGAPGVESRVLWAALAAYFLQHGPRDQAAPPRGYGLARLCRAVGRRLAGVGKGLSALLRRKRVDRPHAATPFRSPTCPT